MRKRWHYIYLSFILLLFYGLIYLFKEKSVVEIICNNLKEESFRHGQHLEIDLMQLGANGFFVEDTLRLLKYDGCEVLISSVVQSVDKFVIRFNEVGCTSCLSSFNKKIREINNLISTVDGKNVIFY